MGDNNRHARKLLLQQFENYRLKIYHVRSLDELHFYAGGLTATAEILNKCRHNGDGKDPIASNQWLHEAQAIIAHALELQDELEP